MIISGGNGERIHMSSTCCWGMAYRATYPCICMCVPVCCPIALFPCAQRHEIYVDDVHQGLYSIKLAMKKANENKLYADAIEKEFMTRF